MEEKKTFRYIRVVRTEVEVSTWLSTGCQIVVTSHWRGGYRFDVTGYEYSLDNEEPTSVCLANNVSLTRARNIISALRDGGDLTVRVCKRTVRIRVGAFAVADEVSAGPLYWYPECEGGVKTHRKLGEYPIEWYP